MLNRLTFEILKPLPLVPLRVRAEVIRPGRRVALAEGALLDEEARPLMLARAWWIRHQAVALPAGAANLPPAPPGPSAGREVPFFSGVADVGYHSAMQWRFVEGTFVDAGSAIAWLRARVPLVEGEPITPLARVLVAADSGNGVSSPLDHHRFVFVNTELSVHLYRLPEGEWICLDARTRARPSGVGLTETVLFDEQGGLGRAAQSLFVAQRA